MPRRSTAACRSTTGWAWPTSSRNRERFGPATSISGRLNKGGPRVSLQTTNGGVRVSAPRQRRATTRHGGAARPPRTRPPAASDGRGERGQGHPLPPAAAPRRPRRHLPSASLLSRPRLASPARQRRSARSLECRARVVARCRGRGRLPACSLLALTNCSRCPLALLPRRHARSAATACRPRRGAHWWLTHVKALLVGGVADGGGRRRSCRRCSRGVPSAGGCWPRRSLPRCSSRWRGPRRCGCFRSSTTSGRSTVRRSRRASSRWRGRRGTPVSGVFEWRLGDRTRKANARARRHRRHPPHPAVGHAARDAL